AVRVGDDHVRPPSVEWASSPFRSPPSVRIIAKTRPPPSDATAGSTKLTPGALAIVASFSGDHVRPSSELRATTATASGDPPRSPYIGSSRSPFSSCAILAHVAPPCSVRATGAGVDHVFPPSADRTTNTPCVDGARDMSDSKYDTSSVPRAVSITLGSRASRGPSTRTAGSDHVRPSLVLRTRLI